MLEWAEAGDLAHMLKARAESRQLFTVEQVTQHFFQVSMEDGVCTQRMLRTGHLVLPLATDDWRGRGMRLGIPKRMCAMTKVGVDWDNFGAPTCWMHLVACRACQALR